MSLLELIYEAEKNYHDKTKEAIENGQQKNQEEIKKYEERLKRELLLCKKAVSIFTKRALSEVKEINESKNKELSSNEELFRKDAKRIKENAILKVVEAVKNNDC